MLHSLIRKQTLERLLAECLVTLSSYRMQWVRRYYSGSSYIKSHDPEFYTCLCTWWSWGLTSVFVQVGKFVQLISTFVGGFVIAFFKGWLLTLVLLSSIPLLVASGAVMCIIISKLASNGQNAYAKAANVVEQTIGSIRTVCHVVITHSLLI